MQQVTQAQIPRTSILFSDVKYPRERLEQLLRHVTWSEYLDSL